MWKKRMLCVVLALCAVLLTACQQGEQQRYEPLTNANRQENPEEATEQDPFANNIDYDDGSYDPASEEGGDTEELVMPSAATAAPVMQSQNAGATPVVIDPIDKPAPSPLPPLTFTYQKYEANNLRLSFDGPTGWTVDDSVPDSYTITNTVDGGMDYKAFLTVRTVPVNKQYNKSELTKEIKGMLDTIGNNADFSDYSPSNTAERIFLNETGIYANYKAVLKDGTKIAGRIIATCVNKTLYTLHVSYPRGYTDTYVDNVYDKFRHSVKLY